MASPKEKPTVLVVEEATLFRDALRRILPAYDVSSADTHTKTILLMRRFEPEVVLLDLKNIGLFEEILNLPFQTKVILITTSEDKNTAMQAVQAGAYDFYLKSTDISLLALMIDRALHVYQLEQETRRWKNNPQSNIEGLIYASRAMDKVCKMIQKVSPTHTNVLLCGESGCGKEILARGIHQLSDRKNGRFVAINCAAIPDNLLESELFGYEKGAFTGAVKQTLGKIESAHGGTLFLDEIGDLPLPLQPKLLRFLQERVIERLGGRDEISVDVRVIGATHQALKVAISENRFREDLYYRLSEVVIPIPPLRSREQDVLLIARALLDRCNQEFKRRIRGFSRAALELIEAHHWPGNVRELENCIKRAVIMSDSPYIRAEDLDILPNSKHKIPFNLRNVREEAERDAIQRALQYMEGNVSKTAGLLGITRPTLYHLMDKLNIREKAIV